MTQTSRAIPLSAFGPDARSVDTPVLDSHIHHIEHGDGDPIVFLHGSPTSSYLWRHVFTRLAGRGRLIAADLIGFGDSGRPDIAYELDDHVRYLDAWFEALDLRRVTLVLQDYGAAFGIDWRQSILIASKRFCSPSRCFATSPLPTCRNRSCKRSNSSGPRGTVRSSWWTTTSSSLRSSPARFSSLRPRKTSMSISRPSPPPRAVDTSSGSPATSPSTAIPPAPWSSSIAASNGWGTAPTCPSCC
ncbi:alpha/beta fold hydrolase [Gordonia sp. (in: high G+C Gram-positive bacteria)]|uniref:alpha/beta fold hydrolase n=1 Tax=Gordonia sp. (in: high G+C Gram-positive bacteria) TaxID=84139 RepID=UPI0035B4C8CA